MTATLTPADAPNARSGVLDRRCDRSTQWRPTPKVDVDTRCSSLGADQDRAATGYWLAKAGIDVAIVEKGVFPRDKTCGDGLTPRSSPSFRTWAWSDELERFHKYSAFAPSPTAARWSWRGPTTRSTPTTATS